MNARMPPINIAPNDTRVSVVIIVQLIKEGVGIGAKIHVVSFIRLEDDRSKQSVDMCHHSSFPQRTLLLYL